MRLKQFIFAFVAMLSFTFSALAQTEVTTEAELKTAMSSDGAVVLGADINVAAQIEIPAGKTVVLDLAGYDIIGGWNGSSTTNHIYALSNRGTLTIKDSGTEGKIVSRGIYNYGTLTLESGIIDACDGNGGYAINNESGSTFIMNGGVVSASYEDDYQNEKGGYDATALKVPEGCTATLNGGTINNVCDFTFAIEAAGTLNIPATSTITVNGTHGAIYVRGGETTINAGTYKIPEDNYSRTDNVLYVTGGSLVVNGGTFIGDSDTAASGSCLCDSAGKAVVNGGTFKGSSGGDVWGTTGTTINGGTFENLIETEHVAVDATITNGGKTYTKAENGTMEETSGVAKVGENVFTTVLEALQYAIDNNAAELKILCDVREKMTTDCYLKINADLTITADAPVKVEFYNDGTTYDFVVGSTNNNTLTIGENVHFDLVDRVIWLGYWGNDVTVVVNGYLGGYQIWHGANTVVNGTLDSHGEAFVMRRNATLTANEGAKVNANYFQIYSGHIVAENATITAGLVWVNNNHNYGIEGTVSFELDNTEFTSNGEVKIYAGEDKTVSVTLENSSSFDAKGVVTLGDNVKVVADATSSIQDANGSVVIPVAKIGDTKYATLEEAFGAATEGETITLLADATPALTSQRAITKAAVIDLGGNTLTLTEDDLYFGTTTFKNGTIVVDPSVKPSTAVFWMFANQTLTFDAVKVVATGVTGTYLIGLDGNNSDLNLLNGSEILIENTTALDLDVICVNASTGNDIVVENSKVNVTNLDGRVFFRGNYTVKDSEVSLAGITKAGFRIEAGQTLSIEGTSTVTIEGEPRDGGIHITDATATYTKAETATVNATVNAPKVAEVNDVEYATLAEAAVAAKAGDEIVLLGDVAEDVTLPAGVKFNGNGKAVGNLKAGGEITFTGVTKATSFGVEYTNTTVNIVPGASLEITGSGRMVIGHGCTFNITGSITDAKTADKATLVPSLKIAAGASITGNGVTFNVTNAYIVANANTTSKNINANGTLDFNINNSIWEQTGVLAFYVPESGMDPVVNFDLKNSVLTTTSHLVFSVTKGEIVFDNSLVNQGTSRQIENRSTMTIKNGSVVNGAVATSSNAINPGTIIVENATYAVTGEFSGAAEGTGTLVIKKGANVSVGSIKAGANVIVDAEGMTASDVINFTADLSQFTGTLSVINNDKLEAQIVDGKIVLAAKPVAKIGEQGYASLAEAIEAAQAGETVTLIADVALTETLTVAAGKNVVLDLNGKKVESADITVTVFGELAVVDNTENKDGKIISTHATGNEAVAVKDGGKFTLNSGNIEGASYGIYLYTSGGTAIINGGTITIGGEYKDGMTVAVASDKCSLTVTGGTFAANGVNYPIYTWSENTIELKGGMFDFKPSSLYIAERYAAEAVADKDGWFKVVAVEPMIAIEGGESFYTLGDAFAAAKENDVIVIKGAGEYVWPSTAIPAGVTVKATVEGVVAVSTGDENAINATTLNVVNVDFKASFKAAFVGNGKAKNLTFTDCSFTGVYAFHVDYAAAGAELNFNNCVFNGFTTFATTVEKINIEGGNVNGALIVRQDAAIENVVFSEDAVIQLGTSDAVTDKDIAIVDCTVADTNGDGTVPEVLDIFNAADSVDDSNFVVVNGAVISGAVAQVNGVKYATLAEAIAASTTETSFGGEVTLLKDVTLEGGYADASEGLRIEKSVTINGGGYTIDCGIFTKGIRIYQNGDKASNVMFKNINIVNNNYQGRCIDTRSGKINLQLNGGVNLTAHGTNSQPLTIGGSEAMTKVVISGGTIDAGTSGYAVICFVPVTNHINVQGNAVIKGLAAFYLKEGVTNTAIKLSQSTSIGTNKYAATSGDFGAIVIEGSNNDVRLEHSGAVVKAVAADGAEKAAQAAFLLRGNNNTVGYYNNADAQVVTEGGQAYWTLSDADVTGTRYVRNGVEMLLEAETCGYQFITVEEALRYAKDGDTVELLANVDLTSTTTISKAITLDGNNHKLTVSGNSVNALTVSAAKDKTVTFKNLELACTGYGAGSITAGIYNTGKNNLVLDNVYVLSSNYAIFNSSTDNIVVNNSTLKGDMYAIYSSVEADIQLNGSTLEKTKNYGAGSAIYVQKSGSKLDIVNSTITAYAPQANIVAAIEIGDNNVEMNIDENSTITIEGNNVYAVYVGDKMYNSKEITSGNYNIAAGATINKPNAMLPTIFIKDSKVQLVKDNVAPVMCFTLQDAVNDVEVDQTVQLIDNLELSEIVTVASGKNVTLDLNGKTLSTAYVAGSTTNHLYAIHNYGELTITDSSDAKAGKISARGNFNYGTLTLEAGTIEAIDGNGGYAVRNYDGATFTMNGGTIATTLEDDNKVDKGGYDATPVRVDEGATFTMNGGVINNICDFTVAIDNHGTTIIKDGEATTVHTTLANHGTMTINGGEFTCNGIEGITAHALWAAAGETTINGGTFNGKDNYNGFNVDASEGAVVNITGGTFLPVHSGSLYGKGTITVSGGTFFDKIDDARCVVGFQAVANENGTYTVEYTGKRAEVTIVDGEVTEFVNANELSVGTLTYERTLSGYNAWYALFVPFEIPVSYLNDRGYEVATFYDVHFSILEGGVVDLTSVPDIHLIKINGGTLKANYPYVIRAKSDASLDLVITLADATLYSTAKSKLNVVESSTTTTRFEFAGTYVRATGEELTGDANVPFYVITKKGEMAQYADPSSRLSPFRVYMTIWNKDGSHVILNGDPAASVAMRVIGEENEDGTTSIYDVYENVDSNGMIFDLQGRRVLEPQKGGMYIIDGKKVIY